MKQMIKDTIKTIFALLILALLIIAIAAVIIITIKILIALWGL